MIQIHTELALERGSDVILHKTATPESFPVVYSMDLASIPQRVCSNNLIPPPLCSSWKRREGGTENKASRTKAEAAIKQRRWCLCKNARLSHCPSECLLLPVSYPGSFFFVVRSVWRSCSRFPPRAGLHRKAGWLAGGTGKETADGGQHVLTPQKRTQMCYPAHVSRKYVVKIATQMADPGDGGCFRGSMKAGTQAETFSPSDLWPFGGARPHRQAGESSEAFVFTSTGISAGFCSQRPKEFDDVRWNYRLKSKKISSNPTNRS